jgi:hypothetical protein
VPVGERTSEADEDWLITGVGGGDNDECIIPTVPLMKLSRPGDT